MSDRTFDVAILGSGIAGSILGAILAENGVRTLLVEQGSHPRFAIGESTVPETTFLFRLLGMRYGVPEISQLSTYNRVRRTVGTTSGVKRNFSFVFHRADEPLRAHESSQLPTLSPPMGPDVHLFRQDVDAYLLGVAAAHGAVVRQRTDVTSLDFGATGVELKCRDGSAFRASYVVDAGGVQAPVAKLFGLREQPTTMRTHSRSIFTHFHGVTPFDACIGPREAHGLPSPLSQGTLHHLFDGGWMWVIPFDNHPSSTNRLTSVGLNLDPRVHPPTGLPADEEFRRFVARYPALAKQFENAHPIREWVSTDRLQFSSTRVVGDRYCLMPHAFAFVDPLFSSGLGISMGAINMLAWRLIEAKKDGDYSTERFMPIDARVKRNFAHVDRLVSRSYVAFSDFELWNAWYKIWALGTIFGGTGTLEAIGELLTHGADTRFETYELEPFGGLQGSDLPEYMALFERAAAEVDAYAEKRITASQAADRIFAVIEESRLWPAPWGSPHARHPGVFTLPKVGPLIQWMQRDAPQGIRDSYARRFVLRHVVKMAADEWASELGYAGRLVRTLGRDFVTGYNRDWDRAD
ncbi:NAD(P)/FAD-dependent oxidoreductase [Sandaracinus amylolyticus]|uniref:NAD(P)/FAD-dependent oxidoreductase n=1 Tax=Sandaracinus amylolyticus TaxID=927083 RepID=UPI001F2F04D3|nr:FAD-dependent monooxygenase [Sandaracinus amylolyticus]UJR78257.1 Monodechloroaminopyrrolnitrin halogenase PrnC [Sandaracinus amylolyticus]